MLCNRGVRLLRYRFSPFSLGYVERIQYPGSRPDPRHRRLLVDGKQTAQRHSPALSLSKYLSSLHPAKECIRQASKSFVIDYARNGVCTQEGISKKTEEFLRRQFAQTHKEARTMH